MAELFHELGIDPKIIASQIVGFILLWMLLAKFLFKPVVALLQTRTKEIKATYERADAELAATEQLKADLDARLAGIETEARARIQSAIKEAQSAKDDMMAEARERVEATIRRGEEELAREREKILAEIREQTVDLSMAAAGKLIGESLDDARHRKLVNDFIDTLGSAKQ
jgi:F-type H+-transporting ATPase subunit b